MNSGMHLMKRINFQMARKLARSSSNVAVELEPTLLAKLENEELKPRHHPGISKTRRIELPISVSRALERAIGDHPVKRIIEDAVKFDKYIAARHPPVEQPQLEAKIREIAEEADRRMPTDQLELSDEEEIASWERKRQNIIKRLMGQRIYAWKPIEYGAYEALVYAIGRGAKEFAVLTRILDELRMRDSEFQPRSYFDFGSGIGTGMWAASNLWKDCIFEYYNVDVSRSMNDLSELILREGNENQQIMLRNVYYRQFLPALETMYDLVVSSYSLFELPSSESRKDILLKLWKKCNSYLVIVEEGSRRGSELVNEARDYILGLQSDGLQGEVFAPCSHNLQCPRLADISDNTPCNFEIGYAPLCIGGIKADRYTARYCYVVLKKGELSDATREWPRLVRPTLKRSQHIICRMCTAEAKLQELIVTQSKHGRCAYRCAKASDWGDRLPFTLGGPLKTNRKMFRRKQEENENHILDKSSQLGKGEQVE